MSFTKIKQIDKKFHKYQREIQNLTGNDLDLYLMIIDINMEINSSLNTTVKSIINVIAIDRDQSVFSVKVLNYRYYFYVLAPDYEEDDLVIKNELYYLKQHINEQFQFLLVDKIELVEKESFIEYKGPHNPLRKFLKIYINDFTVKSRLRRKFEQGFSVNKYGYHSRCFESNISYLIRFMVDNDLSGMSWIKLPAKKYRTEFDRILHINEIIIESNELIGIPANDPNFSEIAPLRLMSFDIECSSYGKFPEPSKNPVITIGINCRNHSNDNGNFKVVF